MSDRLNEILTGFTWRKDEDGQPYHVTAGDPGGATNHGVILSTYAYYRARHLGISRTSADDLRNATLDQLRECIRALVWNAVCGDQLPPGVDVVFFDFAFGSGGGIRQVQGVLGVAQDGAVGPRTRDAVAAFDRLKLIDAITECRNRYVRSLPAYTLFGRGWDRRTRECRLFALGQLTPESKDKPSWSEVLAAASSPSDGLNAASLARARSLTP